jgi:hypothetical protein
MYGLEVWGGVWEVELCFFKDCMGAHPQPTEELMAAVANRVGLADTTVEHLCSAYWGRGTCNRCEECQNEPPAWVQGLVVNHWTRPGTSSHSTAFVIEHPLTTYSRSWPLIISCILIWNTSSNHSEDHVCFRSTRLRQFVFACTMPGMQRSERDLSLASNIPAITPYPSATK